MVVVSKVGITHEESRIGYELWSKNYDEDMMNAGLIGHTLIARYLCESIPKHHRSSARVLDVGAGTGLVGREIAVSYMVEETGVSGENNMHIMCTGLVTARPSLMQTTDFEQGTTLTFSSDAAFAVNQSPSPLFIHLKQVGFQNIDALDSCGKMLEEARKKNCYDKFYVEYLSKDRLDIPTGTYDGLTGSGIYGEGGHVPADALYEMIRLVKPGGYIVLGTRAELFTSSKPDTNKDLEPLMDELERQGKWRKICRDVGKAKAYADYDAIVWKYQVL